MSFLDKTGISRLWAQIVSKFAPKHQASTTDIGEGSELATGVLYLVYEE